MSGTKSVTNRDELEIFVGDIVRMKPAANLVGHWVVDEIDGSGPFMTLRATMRDEEAVKHKDWVAAVVKKNLVSRIPKPTLTIEELDAAPAGSVLTRTATGKRFVKGESGMWISDGAFNEGETILAILGPEELLLEVYRPETVSMDKKKIQAKRDSVHAELGRINNKYQVEYHSPNRDIETCKRIWVEFRCLLDQRKMLDDMLKGDYS